MAKRSRYEKILLAMGIMPTRSRKDEAEQSEYTRHETARNNVKAVIGNMNRWEIDDLEDAGLDEMLKLTAHAPLPAGEGHPPKKPVQVEDPTMVAPNPARRQNTNKPGFFDLPAELRLEIYELYAILASRTLQIIRDQPSDKTLSIPVNLTIEHKLSASYKLHEQTTYWILILKAQLVCHQFREEFLPAWASSTAFDIDERWLKGPMDNEPFLILPGLEYIWTKTRDFLATLPPLARPHVRHIKFVCKSPNFRAYDIERYKQSLRDMKGEHLAPLLERLSDVSEDLTIEVEFIGISPNFLGGQSAKKSYYLRQLQPIRNSGIDWVCDQGSLMTGRCKTEDCGYARDEGYHASHCLRPKVVFEPSIEQ